MLAGPGAFNGQLAALEGTSAGTSSQGNAANQGAQAFANSNSNLINPLATQSRNPSGQPNVNSNTLTQAVNNSNPATQPQQAVPPPAPPTPPTPPPTNVIVTQGRYLANPTFSSFNPGHAGGSCHSGQQPAPGADRYLEQGFGGDTRRPRSRRAMAVRSFFPGFRARPSTSPARVSREPTAARESWAPTATSSPMC